jgi:hypothetical protein
VRWRDFITLRKARLTLNRYRGDRGGGKDLVFVARGLLRLTKGTAGIGERMIFVTAARSAARVPAV